MDFLGLGNGADLEKVQVGLMFEGEDSEENKVDLLN